MLRHFQIRRGSSLVLRFVARAKMHEIQMLGLLEHDVLSSIEVPFMSGKSEKFINTKEVDATSDVTKADADKFDLDTFALTSKYNSNQIPLPTNAASMSSTRPTAEKRASQRHLNVVRIDTIEESPKRIFKELPPDGLPKNEVSAPSIPDASTSPSQSSIRSALSEKSTSSKTVSRSGSLSKGTLASKLGNSWLFNPFRSTPSEPQTTQVSASAAPSSQPFDKLQKPPKTSTTPSSPIRMPPPKATVASSIQQMQQIQPMNIKNKTANRSSVGRTYEEETLIPHRSSHSRRSPINTPPRDEMLSGKRRSGINALAHSFSSPSPVMATNPTRPQAAVSYPQASLARRWQHIYPQPTYKHDLKWKSIVTPGCLPLTVEHFPSFTELESSYDVFLYEFIVDPAEMRSFLVKPPVVKGSAEDLRRAWALVVMRGMAAVRLAQGFQFILKPQKVQGEEGKSQRTKYFVANGALESWPTGAAEILSSTTDPVYLSMTNEIHRISYTGEAIQVKRYVRRMNPTRPFSYQCLIWPKLGGEFELRCLYLLVDIPYFPRRVHRTFNRVPISWT